MAEIRGTMEMTFGGVYIPRNITQEGGAVCTRLWQRA